ncbi:glycoside hydrolase family 30 protein [soil metagenome]
MRVFVLQFSIGLISLLFTSVSEAQQSDKIVIHFDENKTHQTIQNFAASDAWACQFAGNWPDEKRNKIADWLFSMDTLSNGNPKGIGLSLWRYNLGAGSAEQGDASGIKDEWRRAGLTTNNGIKVQAQNWFLKAAKQRGVKQFLGFFNSPPVQITGNGKAYADKGNCNITTINYEAFANYTIKAIKAVEKSTGVTFNYISPVNEPQWDWSDGGQEGCPYNNTEISGLIKSFNSVFLKNNITTKLLIAEAGQLEYLLPASNKENKDDQVRDFFLPSSKNYVGNLPGVSPVIASHSYFTTSPFENGMKLREKIKDSIGAIKDLVYWQSEYCILGDNAGEIKGNKKDTGMDAALYVAKVMYQDLAGANASAWQWWTALSAYDYKDGLIYIDKKQDDGNFSDSKILWAMGNYSRFVRPGMKRISVNDVVAGLLVSGYKDTEKNKLVFVFVNETANGKMVAFANADKRSGHWKVYTTDATRNLQKTEQSAKSLDIPGRSVVTVLMD